MISENLDKIKAEKLAQKKALEARGVQMAGVPFTGYHNEILKLPDIPSTGRYVMTMLVYEKGVGYVKKYIRFNAYDTIRLPIVQVVEPFYGGEPNDLLYFNPELSPGAWISPFQVRGDSTGAYISSAPSYDFTIGMAYVPYDGGADFFVVELVKPLGDGDEAQARTVSITLLPIMDGITSIKWGDDSQNTTDSSQELKSYSHIYDNYGIYIIEVQGLGGRRLTYCAGSFGIKLRSAFIGEYRAIGDGSFKDCTNLSNIVMHPGCSFGEYGKEVFSGCWNLTSVVLPYEVKIGDACFNWCNSMTSIAIGEHSVMYGGAIFQNCYSLTDITLSSPYNEVLGEGWANGAYAATSITLSDNIMWIMYGALNYLISLRNLTILTREPPSLDNIDELAGAGDGLKIYVPDGSVDAYKIATNWAYYANYIYPISTKDPW